MDNNMGLRLEGTIINIIKNDVVIFQYDYMAFYNLWLSHIEYVPEEPDDDKEPEVYSIRIQGNELLVGLLEASDQCGILGIIDISSGELIHAQEAAYYIAGVTTKDKVISLHLVHYYGITPCFIIQFKAKGCMDFSECDNYIEVPQSLALSVRDRYSLSVDEDSLQIINSDGNVKIICIQNYLI